MPNFVIGFGIGLRQRNPLNLTESRQLSPALLYTRKEPNLLMRLPWACRAL